MKTKIFSSPKRRVLVLILAVLVAAIAVMIFAFSSQDAEDSSDFSLRIMTFFFRIFYPGFDQMSQFERNKLFARYHMLGRKIGHFCEFALLGTCLYLLLHGKRVRWAFPLTWLLGTLYAGSDELHQTFVEGRGPQWTDVLIDSSGVLFGILVGLGLLALFHWLRGGKKLQE